MTWAIRKFFDKEFKVMEFTTPLPPSVNEYLGKRVIYVQGKPRVQLYETTDARAFKRHVGNIIKRKMEEIDWEKTGEFEYVICEVVMYLSQKKRDADNHFKCLLDAITASGAIYDDSMVIPRVEDVIIDKENPRVEVRLYRAEKIGVFTNEFALNNFIENYCSNCNRYKRNCSILRNSKENKVTPEITGDGLVFNCSAYKGRCST